MFSFNKGVLGLTHVDLRARASRSHLELGWSQALWIVFGSGRLEDEDRQEDFSLFRSYVKIDSVDMLKFTLTHKFNMFGFRFNWFWILNIHIYDFHE